MKPSAFFSATLTASLLLTAASASATLSQTPSPTGGCTVIKRGVHGNVADAFIWSLYPAYNTGDSGQLGTGLSNSGGEKRTVIGFDLASIPAKSVVTSAKFHIYAYSTTSQTVRAHRVLDPWSEMQVTWANFGGIDPVAAASFVSGGFGWKTLNLTSLVQDWLNGAAPNHGILLEEGLQGNTSYNSSNYTKPSYFPWLEVCYTAPKGSIGDTVWFDANADGQEDAGEPGIIGAVIDLFGDATCDGIADGGPIATAATDAAGGYVFTGLAAGCYLVDVDESTLPPGHVLTTAGLPHAVSLGAGEDYQDADFGYVTTSSIGDTVWLDSDADGEYDPATGELGINGVLVSLYQGGSLIDQTVTDFSPYTGEPGFYLFDSLPQGTYAVVIEPSNGAAGAALAGMEASSDPDGALDGWTQVALGWHQDHLAADFGYRLTCGNGTCGGDESCSSCAVDCGACGPVCGDGTCSEGESCGSCGADCGACGPVCGDATCSEGEDCSSCASDCGACGPVCGDATCSEGEDCSTCLSDCGACAPPQQCGDGTCNEGESCGACPQDCGLCPAQCGNEACEIGESCSSCAADCGACGPVCGDGTCNEGEDCSSCSSDCGSCPVAAPGTGTIGYWKNHPAAWPTEQLTLGGVTYTKAQLIAIIAHPTKGDVTYSLAQQLIAAKLNVGAGNESSCIAATIAAADAWLAQNPLGSNVKAGGASSPWKVGNPLSTSLDNYNNGLLCAPHRG